MRRFVWILALVPAALVQADNVAAEFAARIRQAGLDPDQCYRVRELSFSKEDIHIYLTEGYLILGKPVDGQRFSALFSGEMEGGDGELLLMPPSRSERLSLATFTDSPNLDEHFRFALMIFSDDTAETLARQVQSQPKLRRSQEMGILLEQSWNSVINNLTRSFGARLVYDALSERPASSGFFYAAVKGNQLGNFDVIYDPIANEQIQIGQVHFRNNRAIFDVWTNFRSRSYRDGIRKVTGPDLVLSDYRIEATLEPDLELRATSRATLSVEKRPQRILYFDLSPKVQMDQVLVDGEPCQIWQRESLRANLFRGGTGLFLVVAPRALAPGRYAIEFRYHGKVVSDAGNGVYYVGSRASWYPYHGLSFSQFDITFRYPEGLNLVFTGKIVEDRTEGNWHVTRRRTENPIRLAGFNLGRYEHAIISRPDFQVEVYANREVEKALQPEEKMMIVPRQTPGFGNRRRPRVTDMVAIPAPVAKPDPTARLESLAEEVADAFEFMKEHFGPPPSSTLMVSPIPGTFGQGFPGLLYISTMTYLAPEDRPDSARDRYNEYFFSEILHAHETAHQWWGNTVTSQGYQDAWLMEALANYSALLLLEKGKGTSALEAVLGEYRRHLLAKTADGKTLESAGPISWGPRLNSSQARAWRTITYEKGSWIIHMLRRRLGDDRFLKMLGDLCRLHRFRSVSVEEFRHHAASYIPENVPDRQLENFFDQWIYGTGIPTFKFSHKVRGTPPRVRVTGTVTQSGVASDFITFAPVRFQLPRGRSITRWLRTSEEPASFDYTFKERPVRVILNPGDSVLAVNR